MSSLFLSGGIGDRPTGRPGDAGPDSVRVALIGRMRCVCMYCQTVYGHKPCRPEMDGTDTHGACTTCAQQVLDELRAEISDQRKD